VLQGTKDGHGSASHYRAQAATFAGEFIGQTTGHSRRAIASRLGRMSENFPRNGSFFAFLGGARPRPARIVVRSTRGWTGPEGRVTAFKGTPGPSPRLAGRGCPGRRNGFARTKRTLDLAGIIVTARPKFPLVDGEERRFGRCGSADIQGDDPPPPPPVTAPTVADPIPRGDERGRSLHVWGTTGFPKGGGFRGTHPQHLHHVDGQLGAFGAFYASARKPGGRREISRDGIGRVGERDVVERSAVQRQRVVRDPLLSSRPSGRSSSSMYKVGS